MGSASPRAASGLDGVPARSSRGSRNRRARRLGALWGVLWGGWRRDGLQSLLAPVIFQKLFWDARHCGSLGEDGSPGWAATQPNNELCVISWSLPPSPAAALCGHHPHRVQPPARLCPALEGEPGAGTDPTPRRRPPCSSAHPSPAGPCREGTGSRDPFTFVLLPAGGRCAEDGGTSPAPCPTSTTGSPGDSPPPRIRPSAGYGLQTIPCTSGARFPTCQNKVHSDSQTFAMLTLLAYLLPNRKQLSRHALLSSAFSLGISYNSSSITTDPTGHKKRSHSSFKIRSNHSPSPKRTPLPTQSSSTQRDPAGSCLVQTALLHLVHADRSRFFVSWWRSHWGYLHSHLPLRAARSHRQREQAEHSHLQLWVPVGHTAPGEPCPEHHPCVPEQAARPPQAPRRTPPRDGSFPSS